MFNTKRLLVETQAKLAAREEQLEATIASFNELNREARQEIRDLEERLRDAHSEAGLLRSQLNEVTRLKHELEVKNAVLMERLDLMSNYFGGGPTPRVQGPTSMPEEAEDAMFAFRSGMIDKSELERQLAAAGYDNTEIEFELADYPRHAADQ